MGRDSRKLRSLRLEDQQSPPGVIKDQLNALRCGRTLWDLIVNIYSTRFYKERPHNGRYKFTFCSTHGVSEEKFFINLHAVETSKPVPKFAPHRLV